MTDVSEPFTLTCTPSVNIDDPVLNGIILNKLLGITGSHVAALTIYGDVGCNEFSACESIDDIIDALTDIVSDMDASMITKVDKRFNPLLVASNKKELENSLEDSTPDEPTTGYVVTGVTTKERFNEYGLPINDTLVFMHADVEIDSSVFCGKLTANISVNRYEMGDRSDYSNAFKNTPTKTLYTLH